MAASKAQKEQAARLLAVGRTEHETATELGLGRSTIQRWKRNQSFESMIQRARTTAHLAQVETRKDIAVASHVVLEGIVSLQASESDIATRLWILFEKVEAKTLALLEATPVEDLSARQLPSLIRACSNIVEIGLSVNDRISGMGELVDGYRELEKARQKSSQPRTD